jgi:hypothetical protein
MRNANIGSDVPLEPLLEEATELAKIFAATHRTARRRRGRRDNGDEPR